MTSISSLMLLLALGASPEAEVTLIDGAQQTGPLQALTDKVVAVGNEAGAVELDAQNVVEVRFPGAAGEDRFTQWQSVEVRLVDGSLIYCGGYRATNEAATLSSPLLGDLEVPRDRLKSVRLAELETTIEEKWEELRRRESTTDLLVVRKEDALDFLGGAVGEVTGEAVNLLVGQRDIDVPRTRVFGLVTPSPMVDEDRVVCELLLDTGDRLRLTRAVLDGDQLTGKMASGPEINVPIENVKSIDFGLGRLRYLSDLQETAQYKPVGFVTSEFVQKLRKNENSLGGSLQIGREVFRRGLWIHSGTTLRYRINRDYRKLQGVLGVERSAGNCARLEPRMKVTILADGKPLFESEVAWGEDPHRLDLDVEGVRDLEIRVEPVSDETIGACEHLAIGDARVVK
ncbi:MAG: hypothetical protein DWQ34_25500 [Planctomycetota bacterium]|mgnify:CR=1 FL=1|nr:MAG: hypothetical protein DWQ29_17820 [Planctomycetota bacterium]REJ87227.1 MAG: hypothetical protein DWQ34_25500 [Planctomycetota bacterium]REK30017.1 MAG: hypothetical protein DWQ41_02450 [Planctomycetota bacterium]REK37740.1 MAG: hypothetical protein DWQ45_07070 [Planctomycetota bacterium]